MLNGGLIDKKIGGLPANFLYAGYFLIALSFVAVFNYNWLSLPALVLGLALTTAIDGIVLDLKSGQKKDYIKVFGFSYGKWEKLQKPTYLSIVKVKQYWRINLLSISQTVQKTQYKLNLIYISERKNKIETIYRSEKEEVQKLAKEIAQYFQIEVRDFSEKSKK